MRKVTLANDTIDSFLSRYLGQYSDRVEREFMAINPGVESYGLYLPGDLTLTIPENTAATAVKRRTVWE